VFFSLAASSVDVSPVFAFLTLVTAAVIIVSLILARFKQSLIPGYFLCGAVLANSGLPTLLGVETPAVLVQQLSEVGIILLMFTLGIEFSLSELKNLARIVTRGGMPQVLLTILVVLSIAIFGFGVSWVLALVIGVAIALSSTAVSLKAYNDLEIAICPSGRLALGVALFQDIFVIGFIALLPALASSDEGITNFLQVLFKAISFLALVYFLSQYVIPKVLKLVAITRSRELFTLTVIGLCAGVAFLAHSMGLSLALGAFVAGLVVSESIYSHRVLSDILPFKDVFLTIFFLSVGMLLKVQALLEYWWIILLAALVLILVKGLIVWWRGKVLGLGPKHSLIAAASLASTGEFSLVLLADLQNRLTIDESFAQIFVAVTALTMAITPALMKLAIRFSDKKGWNRITPPIVEAGDWVGGAHAVEGLNDHAVICGYGPVGRSVRAALDSWGVASVVVDLNPETISELRQEGKLALFADAGHPEAFDLMRLKTARVVALTFPDIEAVSLVIRQIRSHYPEIIIIARTNFSSDVEHLKKIGANIVMKDEEEVGHAIVKETLNCYTN